MVSYISKQISLSADHNFDYLLQDTVEMYVHYTFLAFCKAILLTHSTPNQ
jgi:hypothetical protein